jgi:hypothetical protein
METTTEAPMEFSRTTELAGIIQSKFQISRGLRSQQELLWIESLQSFNGEYAPSISFREGASSVFVNITQMKSMAAYARTMAILAGPQGFPYAIKPTPHPVLLKTNTSEAAAMADPTAPEEFKQALSVARTAADGMKNRIDDDLAACQWEEKLSRGALDCVVLGSACFKGPVGLPSRAKKWVLKDQKVGILDQMKNRLGLAKVEMQKYELVENPEDEYRATMEWVSPFELYQDPGGYVVEDCMWLIHRHVMNKAQVVDLATGAGFDPEEIRTALRLNPDGNWTAEPWEGSVNIINRNTSNNHLSKRYVVFEFWGYLSGKELDQAGAEVAEADYDKMHLANIWVLGNNCIKVAISGDQSKRIPFYIIPYEKVPYKLWGRGIPEKMADPQAIINGASRAMVENMGMCVTGDTVVYRHQRPGCKKQRKYGSRDLVEVTINELWRQKNTPRGGLRQNVIRSMNEETGEFFGNRIVDIFCNGEKAVYKITTKNGYTIKATDNHLFMGDGGRWRELGAFVVGESIMVNGTESEPDGFCVDCGAVLSNKTALRCKSCAAKVSTWNVGQANAAMSNMDVLATSARARKLVQDQKKDSCELCGESKRLHIHHIDGNPLNGDSSNLKTLCPKCHRQTHGKQNSVGDAVLHVYRDFDEIESIEYVGVEMVYDLSMTSPSHNFVANGFVVHNCSGPQLIVDVNRLVPGTKYDSIQPWGIWPVKNMEGSSQVPVQFATIPSMLGELKTIQDIFRNFVQEVTSMPDMASGFAGNGQHNRTMGGMSMLFGAADSYTRTVIFNFDNYLIKPMVRAYFDWEMQYNPDKTIKGDMQISASGVSGVMAKELTSQRLAELLQAVGQIPGGADYINMPELMKEVFRSMDIINDSVVMSDTEVAQKRKQSQEQQVQQQGQIAQAQNLPKPKAETTPNDMLLQMLEKTDPTSTVYPIMYAKMLEAINQLDPQSEAALNMMKTKNVMENEAFANEQQLKQMQQDIELSSKMASLNQGGGMLPGDVHAPMPPQAPMPTPSAPPEPSVVNPEIPAQ